MKKYLLSAALLLFVVPLVDADVKVVDSSPQSVRNGANAQQEAAQRAEVYDQLQALKREVAELRGLAEEQAHEISRLKQLQLDNYVDLDRRLGALNSGRPATPVENSANNSPASSFVPSTAAGLATGSSVTVSSAADEYKAAYDLLRNGQSDQAQTALKEFLNKNPSSELAPNACYWLGKISLTKAQLPQAKEWFSKVVENHPTSNKVMDAKLELGKIADIMGDKAKAKLILTEVAASNSESARLAKQYLKENF